MNTDCIHHFSSPQFSLQSLGKNTSDASVVSSVVSSHSKKENVFFFFCCCGWFFTYIFAQSCHLETVMVWLYLYVLLLLFFFFKKTLFAITKMTLKIYVKHVGASKSHTTNSTWLVEWSPSVYSHSTVAGREACESYDAPSAPWLLIPLRTLMPHMYYYSIPLRLCAALCGPNAPHKWPLLVPS